MMDERPDPKSPRVIVVADVDSNAQAIVERILKPSGFHAWVRGEQAPEPDVLVVDITQLRGNPLASLRNYRSTGSEAPAWRKPAHPVRSAMNLPAASSTCARSCAAERTRFGCSARLAGWWPAWMT